ncbi:MAG: hypothetical protein OSB69_07895, partial [Alphaproteobacteria bacterium]|nr:hypothetical protein [Alphaproteobacteria bacterium]
MQSKIGEESSDGEMQQLSRKSDDRLTREKPDKSSLCRLTQSGHRPEALLLPQNREKPPGFRAEPRFPLCFGIPAAVKEHVVLGTLRRSDSRA